MSAEEPGLLGNLPKSRPGTRSAKRQPPTAGAASQPWVSRRTKPPEGDPVRDAVRGVAKVAGAGLRVADGATRHVLRRIPRP